jgi:hypothetical protein
LDTKDVGLVCLCYVENPKPAQVHYALRRLRRKAPEAFILVTLLGAQTSIDDGDVVEAVSNIGVVRGSFRDSVERILAVAAGPLDRPLLGGSMLSPDQTVELAKEI